MFIPKNYSSLSYNFPENILEKYNLVVEKHD